MSSSAINTMNLMRGARAANFSRGVSGVRAIHASPSVLRKGRSGKAVEESIEDEDLDTDLDMDLFDSSARASSTAQTLDKAHVRQLNLAAIYDRAAGGSGAASASGSGSSSAKSAVSLSPQALRQVVATTEEGEVEELKRVVRAWRIAGQKVSIKAGEEIVGRCINLARPDVAAELIADRLQYGLPNLDQPTLIKLHHALLSSASTSPLPALPATQSVSPTLALLRLNILQAQATVEGAEASASAPSDETDRLLSAPVAKRWRSTRAVEGWAEEAKSKLLAAGGAWAEAVSKVQQASPSAAA